MERILPIKTDIMPRAYLGSAYLLGILQAARKEDLTPWILGNFLQVCIHEFNPNNIILNYYVPEMQYDTSDMIVNKIYLPSEVIFESGQIIDFIKDAIDSEEYVIAYLNEYYIPNKRPYNIYHFDHPVLIFGYNTDKEIINIAGYQKSGTYGVDDVPFENIKNATQNKDGILFLYYLKDTGKTYEFSLGKTKNLLHDFINSNDTSNIGKHKFWGIEAYKEFLRMMEKNNQIYGFIDIRGIYLFSEHAKILKELWLFLINTYDIKCENNLEEKIDSIIVLAEETTTLGIKYNISSSKMAYERLMEKCRLFLENEADVVFELLKLI